MADSVIIKSYIGGVGGDITMTVQWYNVITNPYEDILETKGFSTNNTNVTTTYGATIGKDAATPAEGVGIIAYNSGNQNSGLPYDTNAYKALLVLRSSTMGRDNIQSFLIAYGERLVICMLSSVENCLMRVSLKIILKISNASELLEECSFRMEAILDFKNNTFITSNSLDCLSLKAGQGMLPIAYDTRLVFSYLGGKAYTLNLQLRELSTVANSWSPGKDSRYFDGCTIYGSMDAEFVEMVEAIKK